MLLLYIAESKRYISLVDKREFWEMVKASIDFPELGCKAGTIVQINYFPESSVFMLVFVYLCQLYKESVPPMSWWPFSKGPRIKSCGRQTRLHLCQRRSLQSSFVMLTSSASVTMIFHEGLVVPYDLPICSYTHR